MKLSVAIMIALALAGCSTTSSVVPTTKIVTIPSSAPYKFLKWSTQCPAPVNQGIRAHNRAHQAVLDAEKSATDKR